MCYTTSKKKGKQLRIAKEDIIVIKKLYISNSKYISEHMDYNYTHKQGKVLDIVKLIKLKKESLYFNYNYIDEGYHSWSKEYFPKDFNFHASYNKYCIFMIPKGAKYYKNECDEIVSETISFIGEI